MAFYFEIVKVEAGWFEVSISNGKETAIVADSCYLGTSNQGTFLTSLAALAGENEGEKWLLWHDKPCAYIWRLTKRQDSLRYQISTAKKDAFNISAGRLADEAISEVLICGEVKFIRFLRAAVSAFSFYARESKRKEYEKEWGEFPQKELHRARLALRSLKNSSR